MNIVFNFLVTLFGGWTSRMCGGGRPQLGYGLEQWVYGLPYAIHAFKTIANPIGGWIETLLVTLQAPFTAGLAKRLGHGAGIDMARSPKEPGQGRDKEKLEHLVFWLHDDLPRYWYDFLFMGLTGIVINLVAAGLEFYYDSWVDGLVLLIAGAAKAPAYSIGWFLYDLEKKADRMEHRISHIDGKSYYAMARYPKDLDEPTAIAEFLTGVFAIAGLVFAWS